jgi:diaminopimelate decarboxylase
MHDHRSRADSAEHDDLRRCKSYRRYFAMTEIALPAPALRTHAIAKWARDHRVAVDVHTGEELVTAIAAGVRLGRMTVFADALSESELRAVVGLGVGRLVAGSVRQIELIRSVVAQRAQDIVIRMADGNAPVLAMAGGDYQTLDGFRFDSNEADSATAAVIDHEWLNLVGCIVKSARKTTISSVFQPRSVT